MQIGGTAPADRNLISGFWGAGIIGAADAQPPAVVQGNFIGTDRTGTRIFDANGLLLSSGIGVQPDGVNMVIGGSAPGAGNLISGNDWGIRTVGTSAPSPTLQVQGNFIGTDVTGTHTVGDPSRDRTGNYDSAMWLSRIPGSSASVTGNLMSGNRGMTGAIDQPVTFRGNYVGTDVTGTALLPNSGGGYPGLWLGASNNTIDGNLFAQLGGSELLIGAAGPNLVNAPSSGSLIRGNRFFGGGSGLFLGELTSGNTLRDNDFTGLYSGIVVLSVQNQMIHNAFFATRLTKAATSPGANRTRPRTRTARSSPPARRRSTVRTLTRSSSATSDLSNAAFPSSGPRAGAAVFLIHDPADAVYSVGGEDSPGPSRIGP